MEIKVFFNDSCSICRFEINHYKKNSDDSPVRWSLIDDGPFGLEEMAFCHFWSCSPQNEWRMRWDVLVLALVIYSCLLVPYNVAFKPLMGADLTDFFVTAVFYADIVLNFFTGYDVGYQIVMDKSQIILWQLFV